jgi:hypothetical protein
VVELWLLARLLDVLSLRTRIHGQVNLTVTIFRLKPALLEWDFLHHILFLLQYLHLDLRRLRAVQGLSTSRPRGGHCLKSLIPMLENKVT